MATGNEIRVNLFADIARFTSPLARASNELERFAQKTAKALNDVQRAMDKTGKALTVGVTAPLASFGYAAVKAADQAGVFSDRVERLGLQGRAALEPFGRAIIETFDQSLRPMLETAIRGVKGLALAFDELEPSTKKNIVGMLAMAAATGPVLVGGAQLINVAKVAFQRLGDLAGAASSVAKLMPAIAVGALAAGAAFAAFKFGEHLYNEFRVVREGAAYVVHAFNVMWEGIRHYGGYITNWISNELGAVLNESAVNWLKFFQTMLNAGATFFGRFDNDLAKTIAEIDTRMSSVLADFQAKLNKPAFVSPEMLAPLYRQLDLARKYAQSVGGDVANAFDAAFSKRPVLSGPGIDRKDLSFVSEAVEQAAAALDIGDERAKQVGAQLLQTYSDVFTRLGEQSGKIRDRIHEANVAFERTRFDQEWAEIKRSPLTGGDGFWSRYGASLADGASTALDFARSAMSRSMASYIADLTGFNGKLDKLFAFWDRSRELGSTTVLDPVKTSRDLALIDELNKRMVQLRTDALAVRIDALPAEAFAEQMGRLSTLRDAFPSIIDDQVWAAQVDKIKDKFVEVLPVMERVGRKLRDVISSASQDASDQLANFLVHGEKDVTAFLENLIARAISATANTAFFQPLFNAIGGAIGGAFSSSSYTSDAGTFSDKMLNPSRNSAGNAFLGGQLMPFAAGGIVNRPTLFPMARGAGLMGEAGPEAVMPLERVNGKLGVRAAGAGVVVNVIDQRQSGAKPEVSESTGQDGRRTISVTIRDEVRSGMADGAFDSVLGRSFGLRRRGASR